MKTTRKKKGYKNPDGDLIAVGTVVRLHPSATLTLFKRRSGNNDEMFAGLETKRARVKYVFPDIRGLVSLEHKLGGYWTWKVDELEVA